MRFSGKILAAGALAGALFLAGCSGGGSDTSSGNAPVVAEGVVTNAFGGQALDRGEPQQGGEFRFGTGIGLENLDSAQAIGSSIATVTEQIYGQLMRYDENGVAQPDMAESMESDDQTVWTMKLKEGITFHDGTPYNAEAVIAHVERIAAEGSRSLNAGEARQISSMRAVDDRTVEFTLHEAWATFPNVFAYGSLAMVPSPTAVEQEGEQFGLRPVGAGPFKVESFTPGSDVVLTKFDDYYEDGLPYLDRLVFVPSLEAAARLSAVSTGDLDAGATRVAAQFDEARNSGLVVLEQPQYKAYTLLLNLQDPALGDERVREALNRGVDREALNAAVFNGKHKPMDGVLVPNHPKHVDSGWPTFDAERAKSLIAEYEAENGELTLDVLIPQGQEFNDITAIMQQMYKDVGLDINFTSATPPAMVTRAAAGDYQVQMRETVILPETVESLGANFLPDAGANHSQGSDESLTRILHEARQEPDQAKRDALIADAQRAMAEWMPTVPIVTTEAGFVVGRDVVTFPGAFPNTSYEVFEGKLVSVTP